MIPWIVVVVLFFLGYWMENLFFRFMILLVIVLVIAIYSSVETAFDIDNDKISVSRRVLGLLIQSVSAPIKSSRLVAINESNFPEVPRSPNLYLLLESGKKIRIGSFVSKQGAEVFLNKMTLHVPIRHRYEAW